MKKRDDITYRTEVRNGQIYQVTTARRGDREMEMLPGTVISGWVYEIYAQYRFLTHDILCSRRYFGAQEADPVGLAQGLRKYVNSNPGPTHHLGISIHVDVRRYLNGKAQKGFIFNCAEEGDDLEDFLNVFETWADNYEPEPLPSPSAKPIAQKKKLAVARPRAFRLMNKAQ